MRQSQLESSVDNAARRNKRRVGAVIAAGLVTAIVGAMALLNQPADRVGTNAAFAAANQAAAVPAPSQGASASGATSNVDTSKPRFERTDEPAVEESTNSHGG